MSTGAAASLTFLKCLCSKVLLHPVLWLQVSTCSMQASWWLRNSRASRGLRCHRCNSIYDTSKISSFKSSTLTLSRLQDLAGITNFDDSGIRVTNNVAVSLPNVTRYEGTSSREWLSTGVGSVLTFPNLTEFIGPLGIFASAAVKAEAGGSVQLPLLTKASKTTHFMSTGAGSVINIPEMAVFEGAAAPGALAPGFNALDAGKLLAPNLRASPALRSLLTQQASMTLRKSVRSRAQH